MRIRLGRLKHGTGRYDYASKTVSIDVNDDHNPAITYLHELLHKLLHSLGVSLSAKREEDTVLLIERFIWNQLSLAQKRLVLKKVAKKGR